MGDDTELDMLIIRNIADLEASVSRAKELSLLLATEAVKLIRRFAEEKGWYFLPPAEGDINARFGIHEWQVRSGKPDFWFCLGETSPNDELDMTWIAEFIGAGPNSASIELLFDQSLISGAQMRKLLNSDAAVMIPLENQDFRHEYGYIKTPVTLEIEAVAHAICEGDFDAALMPLSHRLEAAARIVSSFEVVASRVRERAMS